MGSALGRTLSNGQCVKQCVRQRSSGNGKERCPVAEVREGKTAVQLTYIDNLHAAL